MAATLDVAQIIGSGPLFSGLAAHETAELVKAVHLRRASKGDVVFRNGDPGASLYVIAKGIVKIAVESADGKDLILALLGKGDFFGELALLDGEPRSADAVALEPCEFLVLDRADFLAFLDAHPAAAIRLLAALSRRLRRTDQTVQDAAFLDVPARLARLLLSLREGTGVLQTVSLTQSDIAALIGATRETVNKWLRYFERRGAIGYNGRQLVVLNEEELRRSF